MFEIFSFLDKSKIKNYLKSYKLALIYSFIVGLIMGSIPFFYKLNENFRVKKLIQEQSKIKIQKKEKICKDNNSEYKKFLSLGFPKTAIEKFNNCMKEK
tara:strand:- start:1511 stop:1807 length:297 start_codon:yes stop_codon:yes gene_type:complete